MAAAAPPPLPPFATAMPPAPPHAAAAASPALSEAHLRELSAAAAAVRTIRRAVSVARFDGWTVGAFGALTLLFGLGSASSMLLGAAMVAVAAVELRAAGRLRRLDPRAARTLGLNQCALAAVLVLYALTRIYAEMTGAGAYAEAAASDPQLAEMLRPVEDLTRSASLLVYGLLIVVAVFAQGGLALYYFRRRGHVERYLSRTPPWVVAVQQADAGA